MRVFFVASALNPHTIKWVNSLSKYGIKIHLFSIHRFSSGIHSSVSCYDFSFLPRNTLGYILLGVVINFYNLFLRPDIANIHYASGYGLSGSLLIGLPTLLSAWGSDVIIFPHLSFANKYLLMLNLHMATRIACTSRFLKFHVSQLMPNISESSIMLTPFGVDLNKFMVSCRYSSFAPISSIRTIKIGTAKGLEDIYGIDILIKAFSELVCSKFLLSSPTLINLELHIAGHGSKAQQLKQLTKELGISAKVIFHGFIDPEFIPSFLSDLDIFACLSRSESFGVAVLEASACGIPVVASKIMGLQEVVVHETTGYLVELTSSTHIEAASAFRNLIENPELSRTLGQNGVNFVRENFSQTQCVKKMVSAYYLTYE